MNKSLSMAMLGIGLLLTSCGNAKPETPLADAKWIGTSDKVLWADYLPQFSISAVMEMAEGSARASLLFGGNDPRLMDRNMNILGVENGVDESYMRVELDRRDKCVRIYRTGYTLADTPGVVVGSLAVADSLLEITPYQLSVTAQFSELSIALNGTSLGKVPVGTLGIGGDYIAYPELCDVGWMVESDQTAKVRNIEVSEVRKPNAVLYQNDGMQEMASDVFALVEPSAGGMPVLRTNIMIKDKKVAKATVYATARGIYELQLNGQRVGEDYLAPGLSQYNRHHFYQSYDVTDMLSVGDNDIYAMLAEGWWSGELTFGSGCRNYFGDQLALLAALEVVYADGTTDRFVTDPKTWEVTTGGEVVYASLFQGQVNDGRIDLNKAEWKAAEEMTLEGHMSDETFMGGLPTAPRVDDYSQWELLPQTDASPKCYQVLTAQSVKEVRKGVWVYDMGQNMAGVPSITFRGLKADQKVKMRYAEVLYPDLAEYKGNEGMLMLENLRGAMVQDLYIARGDEEEVFEPHFTLHGYRYLEITGVDAAPDVDDVKGLVISSVGKMTAHYECSNPLVNRLWQNIEWSMLANFISIPTDCPQRNERMGWSGDLSVFSRTATYLSNVDAFLNRHMEAVKDVQTPDGRMPDVAPVGGAFGGLLWGSVGITVPYECYRQYADTAILANNYEAMKRYMDLMVDTYIEAETGLMTQGNRIFGGLGDWLGPQNGQLDNTGIWDAYYIFDLQIMAEVAGVLGREEDATLFGQRLSERKQEYVERYIDKATGRFIASDYVQEKAGKEVHVQSSYVLPLAFGIIDDEELRAKVLNNLVETIEHPGTSDNGIVCPPYSLMTGFITTAWISKALSDHGRSDLAYRLLQQKSYPSWLYPVTQGATTIWERLDSYTHERGFGGNNSMNSFNHYSFGAVGQWLMAYSAGIDRDPLRPGFSHFILHPEVDPTGEMNWASGWYDTPYGRISSSWERNANGEVTYRFSIPDGCSATLRIPLEEEKELAAGNYEFAFRG